jgi:ABC-type phosphate transport system substrate-binding protein
MKTAPAPWPLALTIAIASGLLLDAEAAWAAGDVVAVVAMGNPVVALSRNEVVDIFLGKASRFPDGSQTVPIDQPEGSNARDDFYRQYAGKSAAQLKAHWSKIIFTGRGQPPKDVSSSAEVKKFVANNPHAIGYIEKTLVDRTVRVVASN